MGMRTFLSTNLDHQRRNPIRKTRGYPLKILRRRMVVRKVMRKILLKTRRIRKARMRKIRRRLYRLTTTLSSHSFPSGFMRSYGIAITSSCSRGISTTTFSSNSFTS